MSQIIFNNIKLVIISFIGFKQLQQIRVRFIIDLINVLSKMSFKMNIENKEIEVGEVRDDGLRLWCAKLALEYAKVEANRLDLAVQRLKNRANNLLGWVITLIILVISLLFTHREFFLPLIILALLLMAVGILCVVTLYSTPWIYTHITPYEMDLIQERLTTELEITEQLADLYKLDSMKNTIEYKNIQIAMQYAWVFFISAPLVAFLIALWIFPIF